MAQGNENFSALAVAGRFAKLARHPGWLRELRNSINGDKSRCISLGSEVQARAAEYPDSIALKFEDKQWTWSELNAQANRYAHFLEQCGAKRGDRIAINMVNSADMLFTAVAVAKLGCVSALINTSQTGDVLRHSLTLSEAVLVVVGPEQVELMATVPDILSGELAGKLLTVPGPDGSVPEGYIDLAAGAAACSDENLAVTSQVTLADKAFLIFTSGTTGLPKASVLTYYRWYRGACGFGLMSMRLAEPDTVYCCLPLYHNNALTITFGGAVVSGAATALVPKFSATRFWDDCRKYEVTAFTYIGELLRYLLNQPAKPDDRQHNVEKICGNGLRPDLWDDFKERFGIDRIHEFYAASESPTGFVNIFNFDKTCGWAPTGWEIIDYDVDEDKPRLDANGKMVKLGKGQTGLMIMEVSENTPYDGYTDKEASEKKLFRDVFKKGDCWFNSGDLIKKLGAGHIQFVDRVGDTFRWQGENVATTEVEAAITTWHQTEDSVVYGVEVPNRDGRCGMISYTIKEGEELDCAGFAAHLRAHLPKYAVPRFMRVQQAQALTGTFKHQKAVLKKEAYDPAQIDAPLYFLASDADAWVPLTPELKVEIDSGGAKL